MLSQIEDYLKQQIQYAKDRREYCKRTYPDYVDDEYNCAEMKFIFGVKSEEDKSDCPPSFCTLNDLVIYYNRDTEEYIVDINTFDDNETEYCKLRLSQITTELKTFMQDNKFNKFTETTIRNINFINTSAKSLEELCYSAMAILTGVTKYE